MRLWDVCFAVAVALACLSASARAQECGDTVVEFDTVVELDLVERGGDAVLYRRMVIQFLDPSTEFVFPILAGYQDRPSFSNDGAGFISVTLNGEALPEAAEPRPGSFEVREEDKRLLVVTHFEAADRVELELSYLLRRVITFPMTHPFEMSKDRTKFNQHFSISPSLDACVEKFRVTTALVYRDVEGSLKYSMNTFPVVAQLEQHLDSEPGLVVVTRTYNPDGKADIIQPGVHVSLYVSLLLPAECISGVFMSTWQRLEALNKVLSFVLLFVEAMLPIVAFLSVRMFAGAVASATGYSVNDIAKYLESSGVRAGDLPLLSGAGMHEQTAHVALLEAVTAGDVSVSERKGTLFADAKSSVWREVLGDKTISMSEAVNSMSKESAKAALAADGMARLKRTGMVWISPSVGAFLAWTGWLLALAAFIAIRAVPQTAAMIEFAGSAFMPSVPLVDIVVTAGSVIFLAAMSASSGSTCRTAAGARLLARVDLAAREEGASDTGSLQCLLAMAAVAQPSALFLTKWTKSGAARLGLSESKLLEVVHAM